MFGGVKLKKQLGMIVFILAFILIFCQTVSAANLTVNPGDSIQSAIDNASDNDTITVNDNNGSAYTYTENLVVNKTLSLQARTGGNVTINALNSSHPVFTVNYGGSGSTIKGFTITGTTSSYGIYINSANSCTITGNIITNNWNGIFFNNSNNNALFGNTIINDENGGISLINSNDNLISENMVSNSSANGWDDFSDGVDIYYSYNNTLSGNTITGSAWDGIYSVCSYNNTISRNFINNNYCGIDYQDSNNTIIYGNSITNNVFEGIFIYGDSSAVINYNEIVGNGLHGLENYGNGTIDATDNWWGINNPVISSDDLSDICMAINGTVNYNSWLVLNISACPSVISSQNADQDPIITVDLTHNNNGDDTSSQGHIPDIPVNFTTNMGTVTGANYTRNGKANATFNRGTNTSGVANISATVGNQTVQTAILVQVNGTVNAPIVNASLESGTYNAYQNVTLIAFDDTDPNPVIYYTTDGNDPTASSTIYTSPLSLVKNFILLKFIAVDTDGNWSAVQTRNYTINLPIIDLNTSNVYSKIQDAINDPLTLNGDIIEIQSGTYVENVLVNKMLIIRPFYGNNVTVQALNPYIAVFTINSAGSGSIISCLTIVGDYISYIEHTSSISMLSANNCSIMNNTIIPNNTLENYISIYLDNSDNNVISGNTLRDNITNDIYAGVYLKNSNNNLITDNIIFNYGYGLYLFNSLNNTLSENNISSNRWGGIYLSNSNNTLLSGNIISNSGTYWTFGIYFDSSNNNTLNNNTISGNYCGGIALSNSSGNLINGNAVTNSGDQSGISISNSNNNAISENTLTNNRYGITISDSNGNIINWNAILNNILYGISLTNSNSTTITGNNITSGWCMGGGIILDGSSYNTVSENTIVPPYNNGIYLLNNSGNNTITGNTIIDNYWARGIYLDTSNNNTINDNTASGNWSGGIVLSNAMVT